MRFGDFGKQFNCFGKIAPRTELGFEIKYTQVRVMDAIRFKQNVRAIDHEKREVDGIGNGMGGDRPKIAQAPMLLGIPEIELNLEAETVIVDDLFSRQRQVSREENDMGVFASQSMGFDDNDNIEDVRIIFMVELALICVDLVIILNA